MQLSHNAVVLVADGRKLLFLRNEGDGEYPNLKVEHAEEHPNPKHDQQATDQAGRASSTMAGGQAPAGAGGGAGQSGSGGGGAGAQFAQARSSMEKADFHQLEEDRFAAEAADLLKRRALAHEYDKLVVIAPPKTLGELRKHYHKEVEDRLAGELAKDLTGHTISDIEKAIVDA